MTDAYPLLWPVGWQRTKYPDYSRFNESTVFRESRNVQDELSRLGASDVIISSNMPRNMDGSISSRKIRLNDTGVAVYFKMNGEDRCVPSDKYVTIEDNLHAVYLTIQALRGLERWGTGQIMQAAFRGFAALPETATASNKRAWHEVLQVTSNASPEMIRAAYKVMAMKTHPDQGGSIAAFQEVQDAYKESGAT